MTKADKTTMTTATTTTSLCAHSLTNFAIMDMVGVTNFVIMVVVPVNGDIQNAVVPIEFPLGSLLWKLYLTSLQKHLN